MSQSVTGKKAIAAARLIVGENHEAAAQAAGVSRATIGRWLQQSDFSDSIQEGAAAIMRAAVATMATYSVDAVETARAIMADESEAAYTRLSAARLMLELSARLRAAGFAPAEDTRIIIQWADGESWRDGLNWEEKQWGQS